MIALKITNIRQLMQQLLTEQGNAFDHFLLSHAEITTFATITIDGHLKRDFYTAEELLAFRAQAASEGRVFSDSMIRWEQVKPVIFTYIKGKRTPQHFLISLCLSEENVSKFLKGCGGEAYAKMLGGLNINLKYDGTNLLCTSGISFHTFIQDHALDRAWDEMVRKFFDRWEIAYEEA